MCCLSRKFSQMTGRVHVVVINLVYRKSRRARVLKLVNQLRAASQHTDLPIASVNFLEAVDGVRQSFSDLEDRYGLRPYQSWAIEDVENKYPSSWRTEQTSGGIASGLSHLDVATLAKELTSSDSDYILVMEDDCVLTATSVETAYSYMCNCVSDATRAGAWDMILLGAAGHRPDIAPACDLSIPSVHVEKAGFSYLTTMYWLSACGSEKLRKVKPLCMQHCLAFDELHNVLAGLTDRVRPDIAKVFEPVLSDPLILLSSKQSMVKQDPHDCVHDTAATNRGRRRSDIVSSESEHDVAPPTVDVTPIRETVRSVVSEKLTPIAIESANVVWYRRRAHKLVTEEVVSDFLKPKQVRRKKELVLDNVGTRVVKFSLMATLMRHKKESVIEDGYFPKSFDYYERSVGLRE